MRPDLLTYLPVKGVVPVVLNAGQLVLQRELTYEEASTVAAWSAFETWYWHAMHGWNWTNMRGAYEGMTTTFKASEIIDGKEVFLPPSAQNTFKYFPDPITGMKVAIAFVAIASNPAVRPNRYADAWAAAGRGDLAGFVNGLAKPHLPGVDKVPGFFTANPLVYLKGVELAARTLAPDIQAFF